MIDYPDNVKPGDVVHNPKTGEAFDVENVRWREARGWEACTRRVDGHSGPIFYPHPDRMPSPDVASVYDLLIAPR